MKPCFHLNWVPMNGWQNGADNGISTLEIRFQSLLTSSAFCLFEARTGEFNQNADGPWKHRIRQRGARMTSLEKPGIWRKTTNGRTALLYLLPSIILFSVFVFYPMFRTIYLSFFLTDQHGDAAIWVGFENYSLFSRIHCIYQQYESNRVICLIHSTYWHHSCRYSSPC